MRYGFLIWFEEQWVLVICDIRALLPLFSWVELALPLRLERGLPHGGLTRGFMEFKCRILVLAHLFHSLLI
jgi:hypothetical protein